VAWLNNVENKLKRGGKKVIASAELRTKRALRTALSQAARLHRTDEAEHIWHEMRERVGASRMDQASFNQLMNIYAQRGHVRRVMALYANMREWRVRPSAHTYSILFNAFANLKEASASAYIPRLRALKEVDMPKYLLHSTLRVLASHLTF